MSLKLAHDIETVQRTDDIKLKSDLDFVSMYLPELILKGLKDGGFKKPSPIQVNALPLGRCGFDLIVQAKSGTGKTLVFSLLALECVKLSLKRIQVLILTPTREIACQIADVITSLGKHMKGLKVGTFIGGLPLAGDSIALKDCQIAIGAPGRVKQLIELKLLNTSCITLFILDEADQLMNDSFSNDIDFIYSSLAQEKQVLMCSATYPPKMQEFLGKYLNGALHVTPEGSVDGVLLGLKQFVCLTSQHPDPLARLFYKQQHLIHILSTIQFDQCIIFSNYQTRAESLCNMLNKQGWAVEWLAGKQEQTTRIKVINLLKSHKVRVLVSTDLAARGIDVHGVNLVINMDLPWDARTYLHRMGRAGRYGSHGLVITIISDGEEVNAFQKTLGRIGGAAMSVSVLPKNCKADLWSSDPSKFEQIHGILSNEDSEESICDSEVDYTIKEAESEVDVSCEKGKNDKKKKKKKKGKKQNSSLKRKKKNLIVEPDRGQNGETGHGVYNCTDSPLVPPSLSDLKASLSTFSKNWDNKQSNTNNVSTTCYEMVEDTAGLEGLASDFQKMNTGENEKGSDCEVTQHFRMPENGTVSSGVKSNKNVRKKIKRRLNAHKIRNSNDYTTSSSSSCSEGEYIVSEPAFAENVHNTQFTEYSINNTQFQNWYNMWYNQNMELQMYVDYCNSINHISE